MRRHLPEDISLATALTIPFISLLMLSPPPVAAGLEAPFDCGADDTPFDCGSGGGLLPARNFPRLVPLRRPNFRGDLEFPPPPPPMPALANASLSFC